MILNKVEQIAKTETLTRDVLLREILPEHNESIYFRKKKDELLSDLGAISSCFDLEESVIIYCFLRLWDEGRIRNFNFFKGFEENRFGLISRYLKHYYDSLEQTQRLLTEA